MKKGIVSMGRVFHFSLILAFAFALRTAFAAELVRNGKAVASIILDEKPTTSAQLGACELRDHVERKTGVRLAIGTAPKAGLLPIYIGAAPDVRSSDFKSQEYMIDIGSSRIVIVGRDAPDFRTLDYGDYKTFPDPWKGVSTLYAVYDFLEMAGFRWYLPSELGTTFTPSKGLSVADVKIRRTPSYEMRSMYSCIKGIDYFPETLYGDTVPPAPKPKMLDPRDCRLWFFRQRVGGKHTLVNHSMGHYYTRFRDTHPDWFAKGQTLKWDSHICYTHPEVIAQAIQDARDWFDGKIADAGIVMGGHYGNNIINSPQDPKVFSIVPMDHSSFCKCKNCQELMDGDSFSDEVSNGKTMSRLFFTFVNKVAKAVRETHPDCRVAVLSYASYAWPPKTFRLEDNVMVMFCVNPRSTWMPNENRERLLAWKREYPDMKKMIWLYYCWPIVTTRNSHARTLPGYFAHHVKDYFKDFNDVGIVGMFWEPSGALGSYRPLFDLPEGYLNWKLAWDNSLDADKLLADFFRNFYGPAEKPMSEFYSLIESCYGDASRYAKGASIWSATPISVLVRWAEAEKLRQLMAEAKRLATAEPFRARVELLDKGICQYILREIDEEATRRPCMQQESVPILSARASGDATSVDWGRAATLLMYDGVKPTGFMTNTTLQAAHDGKFLYLRYSERCDTSRLSGTRLGMWVDDEIEVFFAREKCAPFRQIGLRTDGKTEFVNGITGDNYATIPFSGKSSVDMRKDCWTAYLAVPLKDVVAGGVKSGDTFAFNLFRMFERHALGCWVPTFSGIKVFERMGELHLNEN